MLIKSKVARFVYPTNFQCIRTFFDNIEIQFVRDRGLDHVVEREKDLQFVVNLKNLLKSEPSKSLPLSSIVENLKIPCRAIDFIRKYPSFFEEYFPGNVGIHPHVKLTPESLNLDAQEQLIYDSDAFRKGAADRLLKLLMLCRVNEIPLHLIDLLKWDLGLPDNYADTLVPEFPDYFKLKNVNETSSRSNGVGGLLELVCWNDDMAVSVVEKRAMKEVSGYQTGMPIAFPLQYSKGFELDKKLKKWIDEWQKLPYVSPYENSTHFSPNSDMSDKWVVAVLHELLHIFVPKKTERENLLRFGDYLGVKPRFKRALAHHPGIFYRSNKTGPHTVVLREGYKRGLLIDKHPLMDMRSKYIHLMHKVKELKKKIIVTSSNVNKQPAVKEGVTEKEKDSGEGPQEEMQHSDPDADESSDDDYVDDDDEELVESSRAGRKNGSGGSEEVTEGGRGRTGRNVTVDEDEDEEEEKVEQVQSSRGRQKDGRRGTVNVNEGRGRPEHGRERPRRNASRYEGERSESSRGERNNGRRGFSKENEGRRKSGEGKGRPGINSSRCEGGDYGNQARVEGSKGGHNFDRRGSNESKRRPGEDRERHERSASRYEGSDYGKKERSGSSRGGYNNERRGSSRVNEDRNPGEGRGRPGSSSLRSGGGDYGDKKRFGSSRGGYNNERRGSSRGNDGRNSGEDRGRPGSKTSRSGGGDYGDKDRFESSRGAHSYERRGSSEVNEGRKKPQQGRGRAGSNASRERVSE